MPEFCHQLFADATVFQQNNCAVCARALMNTVRSYVVRRYTRLAYFNQPYFWLLPIKIAEGVKSKVSQRGWLEQ